MNKQVLHVTPYLDPLAGGPPVVVNRLASLAHSSGYDASILTTAAMTSDGGAAIQSDNSSIELLPSQAALAKSNWRDRVREVVTAADILHLHTVWSPLVTYAGRCAKANGVPFILSPHGMLDPYSLAQKYWKKRLYIAFLEKRTLQNAARILFTAEDERHLAQGFCGGVRSEVVALGADRPPAPIETLRDEFFVQYADLRGKKCAIFLGRLHEKKRPAATLRAFAKLRKKNPDVRLLLAGVGEEEARLKSLSLSLGLEDTAHFLGFLSGRQKWQALAAAKVFLLPSQQENFAIALAEALHAGVPALLTSHINIWREVVDAGAGKMLDESDLVESLATLTAEMLNDNDAQKRASTAASSLADRLFDWEASARKTHRVYDSVLQEMPA